MHNWMRIQQRYVDSLVLAASQTAFAAACAATLSSAGPRNLATEVDLSQVEGAKRR